MSKRTKPAGPNRLADRPLIRPLSPNRKLATHRVPDIPPGKFAQCDGQVAMDFEPEDEPA